MAELVGINGVQIVDGIYWNSGVALSRKGERHDVVVFVVVKRAASLVKSSPYSFQTVTVSNNVNASRL